MYGWKYSYEEQKQYMRPVKDPETGEFIRTDYKKLEEMLIDEAVEINKKLQSIWEEKVKPVKSMTPDEFLDSVKDESDEDEVEVEEPKQKKKIVSKAKEIEVDSEEDDLKEIFG